MKYQFNWIGNDDVERHYIFEADSRELLPQKVAGYLNRQGCPIEVFTVTDDEGKVILTEQEFVNLPYAGIVNV